MTRPDKDTEFFESWGSLDVRLTQDSLKVGEHDVMFAWEAPLMRALARQAAEEHGDVLEIGFGMGISAGFIQEVGVRSHTILEPHPVLFRHAEQWKERWTSRIRLVQDFWQNRAEELGAFDAILYDSVSAPGTAEATAFEFFDLASRKLLRPGGRLVFWFQGEALPASFQRELLQRFQRLSLSWVTGLEPPEEARSAGFGPRMLVPVAVL